MQTEENVGKNTASKSSSPQVWALLCQKLLPVAKNSGKSQGAGESLDAKVFRVGECQRAFNRACEKVGVDRITHHDLRHLFATRCIESGVDIPTVSRWLGHKDGGALAMKTYGPLRRETYYCPSAKGKLRACYDEPD